MNSSPPIVTLTAFLAWLMPRCPRRAARGTRAGRRAPGAAPWPTSIRCRSAWFSVSSSITRWRDSLSSAPATTPPLACASFSSASALRRAPPPGRQLLGDVLEHPLELGERRQIGTLVGVCHGHPPVRDEPPRRSMPSSAASAASSRASASSTSRVAQRAVRRAEGETERHASGAGRQLRAAVVALDDHPLQQRAARPPEHALDLLGAHPLRKKQREHALGRRCRGQRREGSRTAGSRDRPAARTRTAAPPRAARRRSAGRPRRRRGPHGPGPPRPALQPARRLPESPERRRPRAAPSDPRCRTARRRCRSSAPARDGR